MKVILSRKGFDSGYGGYPSPVLPDGRMVSLPIPVDDDIHYSDLAFDSKTYYDLMRGLKLTIKLDGGWHELKRNTPCHVDPDIYRGIMPRHNNWKPTFGQIDAAQAHLGNKGIGRDDLFLFFGWFRRTRKCDGELRFYGDDFHIIFGYLQIGEITNANESYQEPEWMRGHPHLLGKRRKKPNNTIYIARDRLTWNSNIPGAGVFDFDDSLVLTKRGYTRSRWDLPDFFREVEISHHTEKSWKAGYFQSVHRGQEFVIESSEGVEKWAIDLFRCYSNP